MSKKYKEIADLEAQIFGQNAYSENLVRETLESKNTICLTHEINGKVVAYLLATKIPPECSIDRVGVTESHRRNGLAHKLMEQLMANNYSFFLDVRAANTPAIELYKSFGFEQIAVRKAYYKNPTEDGIIMRK
jgi:ribosomal-protein-alanine acetyltransferase